VKHSTRTFLIGSIVVVVLAGGVALGVNGKSNFLRWRKFSYGNRIYLQNRGFSCLPDMHYERELHDQPMAYFEHSKQHGIPLVPRNKRDLIQLVQQGVLKELQPNEYFVLDTMYYSYPFLIQDTHVLLMEIGERFQRKLENTGLECTRFTVTSVLRTEESIRRLQRRNRNSVRNSAHLHGTTFDLSYKTFFAKKQLSEGEVHYLGQMLMRTLWELRKEKKCWVTYEVWQTCLHVVSR
jgi:hypothetical protein